MRKSSCRTGCHFKIRAYGATRLYTHSHELQALTALAQHISHSHSGIDEKRQTEKFVISRDWVAAARRAVAVVRPKPAVGQIENIGWVSS